MRAVETTVLGREMLRVSHNPGCAVRPQQAQVYEGPARIRPRAEDSGSENRQEGRVMEVGSAVALVDPHRSSSRVAVKEEGVAALR